MKRSDKLKALVGDYVFSKGGELTESKFGYRWKMPTRFGELLISVHDDDWGSVFCRFQGDNIKKAYESLGEQMNRFSGKWNFHYHKREKVEDNFNDWQRHVKRVVGVIRGPCAG